MLSHKKIFTVSRKIPHHAGHSGYDQLARYVGTPVRSHQLRGAGPLHRYFRNRSGMEWYDGLTAELFIAWHMRTHKAAVYHFLFAEGDFRYLPSLRPDRGHKIVCTFHATPEEFSKVMRYTEHLKSIDAAIVVSNSLKPVLEKLVGKDKVFFIPHGVDTEYFVPSASADSFTKICLCVGHHHRDFDTLGKVATLVKKQDPDVRFVVVNRVFSLYFSPEQQRSILESFHAAGNVEFLANLPDHELLRLYQTSDLMVLPLFDATANVAVLESLSCGLPLVVTDVGGIRDYIGPDVAAFARPQDAERMAEHVVRLLRDRHEREHLSRLSRETALTFDWGVIADQIRTLYHQVTKTG